MPNRPRVASGGSLSIPCPVCGHQHSRTRDSRLTEGGPGGGDPATRTRLPTNRRRRECLNCAHRFSTYEVSIEDYEALFELRALATNQRRIAQLLLTSADRMEGKTA